MAAMWDTIEAMDAIDTILQPLTDDDKAALIAAVNARINTRIVITPYATHVSQDLYESYVMHSTIRRLNVDDTTFYHVHLSHGHTSIIFPPKYFNRIITRIEDAVELVHRNVLLFKPEHFVFHSNDMMAALEQANFAVGLEVTREPGSLFACMRESGSPHWMSVMMFNSEYCVFLPATANHPAQVHENIGANKKDLSQKVQAVFEFWLASRR